MTADTRPKQEIVDAMTEIFLRQFEPAPLNTDRVIAAVEEIVNRSWNAIDDLEVTWVTLVTYRDIALSQPEPDWNRVTLYTHVIEDIATMIQGAGRDLPKIPGKPVVEGE